MHGNASTLGRVIRNPLVVFGLVVLAGDGPLVVAYGLAQDTSQGWAVLVALIAFVFAMGGFFCYLVAFKPRHLYAPGEIPESAFGTSIYRDDKAEAALAKELEEIRARADEGARAVRAAAWGEIGPILKETADTRASVDDLHDAIVSQVDKVIESTRATEEKARQDEELAKAKSAIRAFMPRMYLGRVPSWLPYPDILAKCCASCGCSEGTAQRAFDALETEGFFVDKKFPSGLTAYARRSE